MCPTRPPVTELIDYDQFCGFPVQPAAEPFQRLTVHELARRWSEGWAPYVLDVRKPHEADIVSLPRTDRLEPHETVSRVAPELPRDRPIVVVCRSGGRSAKAARALAELGLSDLYNLEGGVLAWATEIDPMFPTY